MAARIEKINKTLIIDFITMTPPRILSRRPWAHGITGENRGAGS
jgi:hypothetical protein